MTEQELQAIEVQLGPIRTFTIIPSGDYLDGATADYDINDEANWTVAWVRSDENLANFIVRAPDTITALIAEVRSLRAKLDAVPVAALRSVRDAAERDGYTNRDVKEWFDELDNPQEGA